MKSLCTKGILFCSLALLVLGAAACTQSKPAVPTPTLIPLANESPIPANETLVPPAQVTPGEATLVPPPGQETQAAPGGEQTPITGPTPIIVTEPTLLPTPTTVGDTGQIPEATPVAPGETPQPATGTCSNPYTVQPGEWFYAIARKCGVTPQALLVANPGLNPNLLHPGQVLNIPGGSQSQAQPPSDNGQQPPPSTGTCTNPYTVQRGDTLYSIARKCGTTAAALQAANGIPSPDYIFPGQQIQIP
jgi:LysM repeat protein